MCTHTWKDPETDQIWTVNQANQNDWLKDNQKKIPCISDLNGKPWGCNSGTLPLSLPLCLSTCIVPFFLLIHTLFGSLFSIFVGMLFCKAKGPGSCHWPLVYWLGSHAFTAPTQRQSLAGNLRLAPSHCRLSLPEISIIVQKLLQQGRVKSLS